MTTPTAARHSMDSPEWYTPSPIVEAAREVLGRIDLDPASHAEANVTVKAVRFFTEADNGLVQDWHGNVFVNPPGGLVKAFWLKLLEEEHRVSAIWIGYSLEQLQTLQCIGARLTPLDFPICFTRKRIAFVENKAKQAERFLKLALAGKTPNAKSSPSHSNYIAYLGPEVDRFVAIFRQFGQVKR